MMNARHVSWVSRWIAALSILAVAALARPVAAQTPATGEPLHVVATFSILGDLAQDIGGDAVQVTTLIGPGVDAHTFDPAPADLVALEEADVIIENGLGFEPWLDGFFASAQPSGIRVVATEGIAPRGAAGHEEAHDESAADHGHGAADPHVWHDVANAIVIAGTIRDALIAADPDDAALYEANAAALIADLEALDAWVREQVSALPEERRKLVTSHDTFGYFADAYGFTVVGTALGSLSTEAGDPSAREIAMLIGEIEAAGVPAIFAENVSNPDLMAAISEEAGVALAPPLFSDALDAPGTPAGDYAGMVESNVTTIVTALGG